MGAPARQIRRAKESKQHRRRKWSGRTPPNGRPVPWKSGPPHPTPTGLLLLLVGDPHGATATEKARPRPHPVEEGRNIQPHPPPQKKKEEVDAPLPMRRHCGAAKGRRDFTTVGTAVLQAKRVAIVVVRLLHRAAAVVRRRWAVDRCCNPPHIPYPTTTTLKETTQRVVGVPQGGRPHPPVVGPTPQESLAPHWAVPPPPRPLFPRPWGPIDAPSRLHQRGAGPCPRISPWRCRPRRLRMQERTGVVRTPPCPPRQG